MAWDDSRGPDAGDSWRRTDEAVRLTKMLARAETEGDEGAAVAFLYAYRLMTKMNVTLDTLVRGRHDLPISIEQKQYERLVKILSLTASDKEGEAIAAFLMARRLINRLGLALGTIMNLPTEAETVEATYAKCYPTPEVEVIALRKRVRELRAELAAQSEQLARYETAFTTMIDNAWTMHQTQVGLIGTDASTP